MTCKAASVPWKRISAMEAERDRLRAALQQIAAMPCELEAWTPGRFCDGEGEPLCGPCVARETLREAPPGVAGPEEGKEG